MFLHFEQNNLAYPCRPTMNPTNLQRLGQQNLFKAWLKKPFVVKAKSPKKNRQVFFRKLENAVLENKAPSKLQRCEDVTQKNFQLRIKILFLKKLIITQLDNGRDSNRELTCGEKNEATKHKKIGSKNIRADNRETKNDSALFRVGG